jgi:hypothetical protein
MDQSRKIFRCLFNDLEQYINSNLNRITGSQLAEINTDFYKTLHDQKGQGSGGGWLAEYLIFAYLSGMLGPRGKGEKIAETTNLKYSFTNGIYIIPNHRLCDIAVDFAIFKDSQVVATIEVKTSPTSLKELDDYLDRYRRVHDIHKRVKVLMVIFASRPKRGKIPTVTRAEQSWLNVHYIGDDNTLFYDIIKHVKPD